MAILKKITIYTIIVISFFSLFTISIYAQGTSSSGSLGDDETVFEIDNNFNLKPIKIHLFEQIHLAGGPYATIFSWASFIGGLVSIGIVAFWIFLILKNAFMEIKNEGSAEGQAEAFKGLKSTFIGAGIAIAFPIILSILGALLGLGGLWNWPKAFRDCPAASDDYSFYFQARLETETDREAENICGIR